MAGLPLNVLRCYIHDCNISEFKLRPISTVDRNRILDIFNADTEEFIVETDHLGLKYHPSKNHSRIYCCWFLRLYSFLSASLDGKVVIIRKQFCSWNIDETEEFFVQFFAHRRTGQGLQVQLIHFSELPCTVLGSSNSDEHRVVNDLSICIRHKKLLHLDFLSDDMLQLYFQTAAVSYSNITYYCYFWRNVLFLESVTAAIAEHFSNSFLHKVPIRIRYHHEMDRYILMFRCSRSVFDLLRLRRRMISRNVINDSNLSDDQIFEQAFQSIRNSALYIHLDYIEFVCVRLLMSQYSPSIPFSVQHGGIVQIIQHRHNPNNIEFCGESNEIHDCTVICIDLPRMQYFDIPAVDNQLADIEIISKFLPMNRLEETLAEFEEKSISEDHLAFHQSLAVTVALRHNLASGFQNDVNTDYYQAVQNFLQIIRSNDRQKTAVINALKYQLNYVWGPPGTGKTYTGVIISYMFYIINYSISLSLTNSSNQVLVCGPSNKSVDVFAEACIQFDFEQYMKQLKIKRSPTLLRVYSQKIEYTDYPVPFELSPFSEIHEDSEAVNDITVPEELDGICLHKMIRAEDDDDSAILRGFDLMFENFFEHQKNNNDHIIPFRRDFVDTSANAEKVTENNSDNDSSVSDEESVVWFNRENSLRQSFEHARSENSSLDDFCYEKLMNADWKSIGYYYNNLLKELKEKMLSRCDIIFCTPGVSCSPLLKRHTRVAQIITDEAAMSSEPATLQPLIHHDKTEAFVLLGDHKQLQPISRSTEAKSLGLSISLFSQRFHDNPQLSVMLHFQYRMHPSIADLPSELFYTNDNDATGLVTKPSKSWTGLQGDQISFYQNGRFISKGNALHGYWPSYFIKNDFNLYKTMRGASQKNFPTLQERRVVFLNAVGTEETTSVTTDEFGKGSKRNMNEVNEVTRIYKFVKEKCLESQEYIDEESEIEQNIAVLTPYRYQMHTIFNKLTERSVAQRPTVTTFVASQGSEYDYVILSMVRSVPNKHILNEPINQKSYLGFVTDANQVNVALTRARRGLIIIGNSRLLSCNALWKKMIDKLSSNNCYIANSENFPSLNGLV